MATLVGNTIFNGQTVTSATLDIVDQVTITPSWYTDYPTRTLVNDGSFADPAFTDDPSLGAFAKNGVIHGDWSSGPYLLTGLDYYLDVYVAGAPAGTNVQLNIRSIDVPNIGNPSITSIDSNVTQSNGICRFKIRFENPTARSAVSPIHDPHYQDNYHTYYVHFEIITSFGKKLHRVLVYNSGLGSQEPVISTNTSDKRIQVWNRDGILFLPVNRSIRILFVGGGGGGGGGPKGGSPSITEAQSGIDALLILKGKHQWLRWFLSNTLVNGSGNLINQDNIVLNANGGQRGGYNSTANHTASNLGGAGGVAEIKFFAYGAPSPSQIAQGKSKFPGAKVSLIVNRSENGPAGNSTVSNVDGGAGYYFMDTPNVELWGFGGKGGRKISPGNCAGYGGGGGGGAQIDVTIRYENTATADRNYVPPLMLDLSRYLAEAVGGRALNAYFGDNGTKGGVLILSYGAI